jgi:hypothetical protein
MIRHKQNSLCAAMLCVYDDRLAQNACTFDFATPTPHGGIEKETVRYEQTPMLYNYGLHGSRDRPRRK